VFNQCYQSIATTGKRIYADNERELAIAVGDNGAKVIKISKDMKTEDFRVFIKRENSEEMLRQAGNSMAITLLQLQLIDKATYANLYNRSTPDEVAKALRASANSDIERQRMQDAMQQQMMQQEKQQEQDDESKMLNMQKFMMDREDQQIAMNHDNEIDKILTKGLADQMKQTLIGNQAVAQNAQKSQIS
jgi:hypothetical protein